MSEHDSLLHQLLICPICKQKLEFLPSDIKCKSCGTSFPQISNEWFNLMPTQLLKNEATQWEERLLEMEDWYKNLTINSPSASECFVKDYDPYAPFLANLSGYILDVGGGIGIPRNYLPPDTKYMVIDPSIEWLRTDWSSLVDCFPCLENKPDFVRGIGEYLPFPSESFDGVLSFWSMNHASEPKLVFGEIDRVLRPGGKLLLILEEMIPQLFDLINPKFPSRKVLNSFFSPDDRNIGQNKLARLHMLMILLRREEWPLQNDHIRIQESEIRKWTAQSFEITKRIWIGQYLTFEFKKN